MSLPRRLSGLCIPAMRLSPPVIVVLPAAIGAAANIFVVPGARGMAGGALALLMILIAAVDARRYVIPDQLTAASLIIGCAHAVIVATDGIATELAQAAWRAAVLAGIFWSLRSAYRHLRGRDGMGLGDVKLAGVAGVWLDWPMIPIAIEIAALAGLTAYLTRHLLARKPMHLTGKLPFGLFFAPAIWLAWLFQSLLFVPPLSSF
jgi:leader peptidase (prepilin peptidase) / N-methyltransferase